MGIRIVKYIKYLWNCVLEVIYDSGEKCVCCGEIIEAELLICYKCLKKIKFCENFFYVTKNDIKLKCYSSAYYGGVIKNLILKLKYSSDFNAGEVLVHFMANTISAEIDKFDLISFVPSSKKSYSKRGFNQSEFLARKISEIIDIPCRKTLIKVKESRDQIGLSGEERWKNLQSNFGVIDKIKIKNKNIILVDDVITTGATTFLCADELIKNGANQVIVLTVAKSSV